MIRDKGGWGEGGFIFLVGAYFRSWWSQESVQWKEDALVICGETHSHV